MAGGRGTACSKDLIVSATSPIRALDNLPSGRGEVGSEEIRVIAEAPKQLHIGGWWRDARGGAIFAVQDPSLGRSLCQVADASGEDAQAAMDAAANVQPSWDRTAPNTRSEVLWRVFELLQRRADDLALLLTLEMGKGSPSRERRFCKPPSTSGGSRVRPFASKAPTWSRGLATRGW